MTIKHFQLALIGMQCVDCENNIEEAVIGLPGVLQIQANFTDETIKLDLDTDIISLTTVKAAIKQAGYDSKPLPNAPPGLNAKRWFFTSVAILSVILLFQADKFVNFDISLETISKNVDYGLLFLVGILTGFHCIGMCGGFVLSYTVAGAKANRPSYFGHLSYGFGKTLSYMLFGALFGAIGGAISFTLTMRSAASLAAGLFLTIYGLGMLETFHWLRRFHIRLPRVLAHKLAGLRKHTSHPLTIGLLNGLMIACGPLQAMYVLAAGTGDPTQGALMLGVFALGTLPVMFAFGYLANVISYNTTRYFLKASSLIVVVLGISLINRSQVLLGNGYDLSSMIALADQKIKAKLLTWQHNHADAVAHIQEGYQIIYTEVEADAYLPEAYTLRKGVPVKWIINVKELSSCNKQIVVPKLAMTINLKSGLQLIEFLPEQNGVVRWSCYMGMIPGTFIIRD